MGVRAAARLGARQESRMDLGRPGRTGGRRRDRPGGQGLPGKRVRESPVQGEEQARIPEDANRAHAQLRSPGERANAQLKNWRILRKLRCCPWRAGQLAKAIHAGGEDPRQPVPSPDAQHAQGRIPGGLALERDAERCSARRRGFTRHVQHLPAPAGRIRRDGSHPGIHPRADPQARHRVRPGASGKRPGAQARRPRLGAGAAQAVARHAQRGSS